jgi:hypothetical protein
LRVAIVRNGTQSMLGRQTTSRRRTMDQRESDPTGAFSGGGAAGMEATEFERHAPHGSQPGGGQPNNGEPATQDGRKDGSSTGDVDEAERDVVTGGTAATSEIADPEAQSNAERQGDGTPLRR